MPINIGFTNKTYVFLKLDTIPYFTKRYLPQKRLYHLRHTFIPKMNYKPNLGKLGLFYNVYNGRCRCKVSISICSIDAK